MVIDDLPGKAVTDQLAYRLIPSKFPPIALFDDVASPEAFHDLYALQALTNPRLRAQAGDISRLKTDEIPWGVPGCSYAVAPFTHVNPNGSRFGNGDFGVLYLADTQETAIREVSWHQGQYWQRVEGLKYDRLVFRGLTCRFSGDPVVQAVRLPEDHPIYTPDDYGPGQRAGQQWRDSGAAGVYYHSVRHPGHRCWGLFTPRGVHSMRQTAHIAMIWNGERISAINRVSAAQPLPDQGTLSVK